MTQQNPDLSEIEVEPEQFVNVAGINSNVIKLPENHDEPFTIGHVLMIDVEQKVFDIENISTALKHHNGTWFISKSSENGYHIYNPVILSLHECYEVMHRLKDSIEGVDADYIEAGYDKGGYTLRVSKKGSKDVPEPIRYVAGTNTFSMTYSEPHLDVLDDMGFTEAKTVKDECRTVGDTLEIAGYRTRPNNHVIDAKKQPDDLDNKKNNRGF